MIAPDKIYVLPEWASVVKVLDEEVEYIRKDALLEWAKGQIWEFPEDEFEGGINMAIANVIEKINSL